MRKQCKKIDLEIFDKWLISLDHVTYWLSYQLVCDASFSIYSMIRHYMDSTGNAWYATPNKLFCKVWLLSVRKFIILSLPLLCHCHSMWPTPTKPGTSAIFHKLSYWFYQKEQTLSYNLTPKSLLLSIIYLEIWHSVIQTIQFFYRSSMWENDG